MRELLKNDDTKAVLLVDASNAFNVMNSMVAIHNIHRLCSSIATILINMYQKGPSYGYHVNLGKPLLMKRPQYSEIAKSTFVGTEINIITEGRPHIGVPLGCA